MKDDVISRQGAIDAFKKELTVGESKGNYVTICSAVGYEGAKQILESLPSAQPEIIHCGDCKYYGRADKRRFYRGMDCLNKHIATIVPDRDFCSRAERRTDET